jgi:hypothetical protein
MKLLSLTGTTTSIGNIGGKGLGPFGKTQATTGPAALTQVTGAISAIIGVMTIAGSIWFLFQLLFGGYEWISSAGDTKKLTTARERIMNGFFGLIIVVGAWALVALVGKLLGYDILVSNPTTIINNLQL